MFTACCRNKAGKTSVEKSPSVNSNYNYTGSSFNDNYVWGGAMNMAWNELKDNFVREEVKLDTRDPQVLETLKKLNKPVFSKQDMDEASYYVKSGYGQGTINSINKECRAKFPTKSIDDLKLKLGEKDIISYAYFLKEIEYQLAFTKQNMRFDDNLVKGFAVSGDSYANVYILDYVNDDKFLIGIKLKDNNDQIFLAKGYPMDKPDEIVKLLREKAPVQSSPDTFPGMTMNKKDFFQAPILHLDYNRSYKEMIGQTIMNGKLNGYVISVMQEIVKFDMDEKGARVENEAYIGLATSAGPGHDVYKPKQLLLDKPYWVMMKRFNSDNPYFILGVQNIELMKAAE
jgi:hypothetical protein